MERNPKPKVPNGSTDKNGKNVAPPNIGDVPSSSNGYAENQASGSLNTQNGDSAQTSIGNNKDEAGDSKIVVEDPFDNERRQILFNAINQLQLVVVGEQSAGKSSLLKSLTGIPFPVKSGIGTHFPIRIVSRRTAQGSSERFHIDVEKAPNDVEGLEHADQKAENYVLKGDTLTMSMSEAALQDLSENHIGIRKGSGQQKKNFVADIVRVDLSGPNRPLFNILDLPGLVNSSVNINKSEMAGTHRLAIQYIKNPKNTVICTLPATAELSTQKVIERCREHVPNEGQLIGVFTKCDMVTSPKALHTLVSSTKTRAENSDSAFQNGMFVVCNGDDSGNSVSGNEIEQKIFDKEPWTQIPAERRGTSKLKNHLGEILTSQIEKVFPQLERDIQLQLSKKNSQLAELGDPRTNLSQSQAYLNQFVRKYSEQATKALMSPGSLESRDMDIRQKLGDLNAQFANVMRWVGGVWTFVDVGIDPHVSCGRYRQVLDNNEISGKEKNNRAHQALYEMTDPPDDFRSELPKIPAFDKYKRLESSEDFAKIIKDNLGRFGASQPRGVVNSDIYPVIYRLQISKWGRIAQEHLERVRDALKLSYETILKSTCPDTGSTSILYKELKSRLHLIFEDTFLKARQALEWYCKQETERVFLQTNDDRFPKKLDGWRSLSQTLVGMWTSMDLSNEDRMMMDIHDVVKVYYEISLESFTRHVSQTITESFVMDKDGPLSKLTSDYVFQLSETEIGEITREDKNIGELRDQVKGEIAALKDAQEIAKNARDKVEKLKAV
ncbi:RBTMx2-like protein [Fusarium acuminatum]|uniref:RBTMx2-like protein n=1 Tax=Fusarium acuminatum TaxID=5515 RepID=A0ABZ2X2L7_9HYPO